MKLLLLIFILFSISLLGCGSDNNSPPSTDNLVQLDTKRQLEQAIETSRVTCGESHLNCPSNVGKLNFWFQEDEKFYLGSCSGTLIDEQYFITNSHCLPIELRENGKECSKQMNIQFPKTNKFPRENLNCILVSHTFPYEEWYPDLAVIKVQKSKYSRVNTSLKKNDLSNKQPVHAYTMNPSKVDKTLGTIVRKDCLVSLDNAFTFEVDKSVGNFLITGSNCHIISGNSGSGLFNSKNELIGVVHIKIENDKLEKIFNNNYVNFESFTHMGFAVNINCLKEVSYNAGESCQIVPVGTHKGSLDNYLDNKVRLYNLLDTDETKIKAVVLGDLSIKLSRSDTRVYLESLTRMRRNLVDIFNTQRKVSHQLFSF
ncbi:MAG: trypsin-like peptidase domain-containing protein [Bacteriovoracaceae bacterium]|jgi:hypothetical protein|nr:trypsin-like peptidase domain-containing protein [Bacteriovoracaceae bacterium]